MYDNIPEQLRNEHRWVCWQYEDREGKPTKVCKVATSRGNAQSNNPATWRSFSEACEGAKKYRFSGIGFVLGDGWVGVDIDDCYEGEVNELARDIISTLDSYTEYSPSGNGIHVICHGELPAGKRQTFLEGAHLGIYDTARYFCMTGRVMDDAHMEIEERTAELALIHSKYLGVDKKATETEKTCLKFCQPNLQDEEIIEKACAAKNGKLFESLMNGVWKGQYGSQSEADLALCNILAFWCGGDSHKVDGLFRRSGLMRKKWDEIHGEGGTYGQITMARAVEDCRQVYEKKNLKNEQKQGKNVQKTGENEQKNIKSEKSENKNNKNPDTCTDLGRSKVLSEKYRGDTLWCEGTKSWYIWDGKHWKGDDRLIIRQMAKDVVAEMIADAGRMVGRALGEEEVKKAKAVFRDTMKVTSERGLKAMIELAKSDLPVTIGALDADPFLLNCQNGVVDLRTGKLRDHDPELMMTRITKGNYDPGKKFELFDGFLKMITCGNTELADYFQQVCGMAAIGKVFNEGLCIFYGQGDNGKSSFLNSVAMAFGDYAGSISPETLMSQKDGKKPFGITKLDGLRFVTAMELEEGRRLSGSMLKQLASVDPIVGEEKYEKSRTWYPTHTLIMSTNFLPKVGSTDKGTWKRISVVPFKADIKEKDQIKDFATVLFKIDADAILSWVVAGAIRYAANNFQLSEPKIVKEATEVYRSAEDWLGNFINECCEVGDFEEAGGRLFETYMSWCEANNEHFIRRSRDFAEALRTKGYDDRHSRNGSVWTGLRLLDAKNTTSLYQKYQTRNEKYKQGAMNFLPNEDGDGLDDETRRNM